MPAAYQLQVNSIGGEAGEDAAGGPMWSRFFGSLGAVGGADADTESVVSDHAPPSSAPVTPARPGHGCQGSSMPLDSDLAPNDSASVTQDPARPASPALVDDGTYLFKFVAPGGTTHRFQARYDEDSLSLIREIVGGKLSADPYFSGVGAEANPLDFQLVYLDDDGDRVLITHDRDITDSVATARKQGRDRVVLTIIGGKGWKEVPAPAAAKVEEPVKARPPPPELVFGVLPKDLALPAALGALSIVIVGVFLASRGGRK
jgi:hypothetical protein